MLTLTYGSVETISVPFFISRDQAGTNPGWECFTDIPTLFRLIEEDDVKNSPILAIALATMLGASTAAYAQAPAPAAPAPAAPAAQTTPAPMTRTGSFVSTQAPDQWLASQVIGMNVYGPADESLGDVSDVLFDRQGNVIAAVIGVGGFLGIGQKAVAVPITMVEVVRANDTDKLVLRKTKDELKAAPEFQKLNAAPVATGTTRPVAR